MTLKADMLTDLDDVFFDTDESAEAAAYTPSGGEAVSISIIPDEQDPSIMSDAPPGDEIIVCVKVSDVSNPQRGDTLTLESETWYLVRNLGGGSSDGTWRLLFSRSDKRRV